MHRPANQVFLAAVLFTTALVTGGHAFAQSVRGAIAGNVTDVSGAFIPGATITASSDTNGGKSATKSTSAGVYRFPDLPIGTYTVTVSAPGFQTQVDRGVEVQVNSTSALDVKLSAGAVSETVTVDASAPRIETESSEIGGTVSDKQIEDLPLSLAQGVGGLRSPETFVFLLPGTTGPGSATTGGAGQANNGVFLSRLSGGQAYGAETILDGASIQRSENGSSFDETSPSIEALQEFKVTTSTPSAEFGRTTSGIESFSTKSGTNAFHGTGYLLVKNAAFDANNWFNNGFQKLTCANPNALNCSYRRLADSKYDFGGVLGGPVSIPHLYNGHDRTFFLFAWEQYRFKLGVTSTQTVPTAAERMGNFQADLGGIVPGNTPYNGQLVFLNPCTNMPVLYNQIFDPTTSRQVSPGVFCRTPYPNNIINVPLSPTAQKLIAGLPLPNQAPLNTDVTGFTNNYSTNSVAPTINTTYTIRIDQSLSRFGKIFASFDSRQNFKGDAPDFPTPFDNAGYPQIFTTHYSRAGWDYDITPSLLNHLNLGYNRTNSVNVGSSFGVGPTGKTLGIPNDYSAFFPLLVFPSPDQPSTLGQQQNGINVDNGIRVNDIVTWLKGRNSVRVGVDYRHQQYSANLYNQDTLNFYRDQTAAVSYSCCASGNPIASFDLGEVGNGSQAVFNVNPRWKSFYVAGFVQDDIKVTNNLTVNVGVRYDIDMPRHEALNRTSELSFTAPDAAAGNLPGALVFGTTCGTCNTAWADAWYKDVAPRIGFAYVLPGTNNKAVIRGGGAIIYGPLQYSDFGASMLYGYNQSRDFFYGGTATQGGAFTPAFRLDSTSPADPEQPQIGFPNVSYAPNTDPTQLTSQNGIGNFNPVGGEVIEKNWGRPSMTDNWSIQLQDEIAQDLIFTLGYIGQSAQNLHDGFLTNINNVSQQYFGLGDPLGNGQYTVPLGGSSAPLPGSGLVVKAPYANFTGQIGQALRPFPQYDYIAGDCCLENLGHSSYNAMVVSLQRRFRNGFNLQASYTWEKTLTDADSTIPFSYATNNQREQAQDTVNLRNDRAYSVQDIPQNFTISYLYQFPFGKGRKFLNSNRALDYLIGGWQVGAIQHYTSGQPIGFGCASGIPFYQNCIQYTAGPASNNGTSFSSGVNQNEASQFNGKSWFKPAFRLANAPNGALPMSQAAFVDQNLEGAASLGAPRPQSPNCGTPAQPCSLAPFKLGNLYRITAAVRGPRYEAEDVSLLKNFTIKEGVVFQLKGEAFDIFNRHRMGLPDLAPGDSTQSNGFGIPTYVDYGPRNLQVSGRFNF